MAKTSTSGNVTTVREHVNPVPYLAPWAVAFAVAVLAGVAHLHLPGDAYAWYWSLFIVLVGIGCTLTAWGASRPRGWLTHLLATVGMASASCWAWWIIGVGNVTWRPLVVYIGGMLVVCGGSNWLTAMRGGSTGRSMHDNVKDVINKVRNLNETRVIDGAVVSRVAMEPGVPVAELQGATKELASLYGVPANGVRITEDKGNAGEGEMRVVPVDYLATPPPYTGPSIREGGTVLDPVRVGVREGGQPLEFWLAGDPTVGRNASMIQVTGMSGSGKSIFIQEAIVEGILSRGMPDQTEYWYLDSRKGFQAPKWVRDGAARFEGDRKGVVTALKELYAEMPDRARHLGERGLAEWEPGCGLPFRLVVCDEFADVASAIETTLVNLMETLRSLGIVLMMGFQRATGDRFPTSARSNVGTSVCFGVRDDVDAGMALPDDVLEAGAKPWVWQNKSPGYCYLTAPGVPEELWPAPARTHKPNKDLIAQWAEHYIARRAGAPSTAPAAQHAANLPAPRQAADPVPVDDRDDPEHDVAVDLDGMDDTETAAEADELLDDVLGDDADLEFDDDLEQPAVPDDLAGELAGVDHRAPITQGGGGMVLALSPKMSDDAARQALRAHITALAAAGVNRFKTEEIGADILEATGMSASWLRKWLTRMADEGLLVKVDERGWYDIPPARVGNSA